MNTLLMKDENSPTGDDVLDELLKEARRVTKLNWQCNVVTHRRKRFILPDYNINEYWLVFNDNGHPPWRMVDFVNGDINHVKCFLTGVIMGADAHV